MNSGTPTTPAPAEVEIPNPVNTPANMPDVTSETGALDNNAKLIWTMVRFTLLDTPLREKAHEGDDGYLWDGVLSHVLVDLWPILRNAGANGQQARLLLNQYLRLTHNMVCLDRGSYASGGKKRKPMWWVRKDWLDQLDRFRVTSNWPAAEADDQQAASEVDDVFGDGPLVVEAEPKVYTCDWPGECDMGEDGKRYTSTRPNVMPLHRRNHENTERIVNATVQLLREGADPATIGVLEIASKAGMHQTSVHNRFARNELVELAESILANERGALSRARNEQAAAAVKSEPESEPQAPTTFLAEATTAVTGKDFIGAQADTEPEPEPMTEADPQVLNDWIMRLVRVAAFAELNGTAMTPGAIADVAKIISPSVRDLVWEQAVATGALVERQDTDYRGRGRTVWVAPNPQAVLAGTDFLGGAPAVVDFVAELTNLLERYASMDAALATRDKVIYEQGAQLTKQEQLLTDSRDELHELRNLIAPLMKFTGGPAK